MIRTISLTSAPTPGALLGTVGSRELINSINSASGASAYFGSLEDPFKTSYQSFMTNVIQPIREVTYQLREVAQELFHKTRDEVRRIDTLNELEKGIPPCMYDVYALYEPINKLALQGRVDVWGIDPTYLKEREDYWGRLISNGTAEISTEKRDEYNFTVEWVEESTDPYWTIEMLEDIEASREYVDKFYENEKTKMYDITSYPDLKG